MTTPRVPKATRYRHAACRKRRDAQKLRDETNARRRRQRSHAFRTRKPWSSDEVLLLIEETKRNALTDLQLGQLIGRSVKAIERKRARALPAEEHRQSADPSFQEKVRQQAVRARIEQPPPGDGRV